MSTLKETLRQSARLVEHASPYNTYLTLVKLEEEQPSTVETYGDWIDGETGYRVIELERLHASAHDIEVGLLKVIKFGRFGAHKDGSWFASKGAGVLPYIDGVEAYAYGFEQVLTDAEGQEVPRVVIQGQITREASPWILPFGQTNIYFSSNRVGSYDSRAYCTNDLAPQLHGRFGYVRSSSIPIFRLLPHFERYYHSGPRSWQITLGHSVLVNEDIGEVAGGFDKRISAQEDPTTWERGHEKDSIIEVSEGQTVDDEHPLQFFARAVPSDQHD
ncbi:hypothetical protein ARMSODRAFT_1024435 [Armillaria solidipes]|uniref:Uncharacterized protein n=1 Tax=Armillaria solidipes TaxID=1076256 RepID=A0A2H3AVZ8_9AGAR|nr:hypothetical protein ARMSODRAFT_1024435 [Armillaria solidipes]